MKLHRFNPKHKRNTLFFKVLVFVGAIMTGALVLLASMIVQQAIFPKAEEFEAPKPMENPEQKKVKRKVVMQKSNKRANNVVKRINIPKVQQTTPQFTISLPSGNGGEDMGGIGVVNMGGLSLEKMEIEIPPMEIFGTKASSDRVFIAFEATKITMTEEMGGLDAYNVVKGEMKKLVNSLPSTILFNIMAFNIWNCHLFETCFPSLTPATAANKATFETWINRINNDPIKPANLKPNLRVKEENIPPYANEHKYRYPGCGGMEHGILGRYEIYQAALESHAGAVWILTLDWPLAEEYIKPYLNTEEEIKKYNDTWKSNLEKAKAKGEFDENGWAKWQEACKPACEKARQWLIAENKRRAAKGIPQMVEDNMLAVADRLKIPHPPAPRHPDYYLPVNLLPKKKVYTKQSLYAAYEPLLKKNYDQNKLPRPTVNVILLMRRDGKFAFGLDSNSKQGKKKIAEARSWAKMNGKGTARILRAAKPVSEFEDK